MRILQIIQSNNYSKLTECTNRNFPERRNRRNKKGMAKERQQITNQI